MLSPYRKRTIIACISLLAMTLAVTAFAETIGQRIMRLRREKEQGIKSTYTRDKPAESPKEVTETTPKTTVEVPTTVTVNDDAADPTDNETPKPIEKTVVSTPKTVPVSNKSTVDSSNPMNLVPADALVCLRINNFNNAIGDLDKYITGLTPAPISLPGLVVPQIANILGSQLLSGIDLKGDVIAFLNNDMTAKAPPIVVLIPLTSYQEFTSGNPNCSKADADGISTISPKMSMLGKLLTVKAPGGKYAYVCMEDSKPALIKTISSIETGSLGAKITANEQKLASAAPLWVYGNIEQAAELFKPTLREMMAMAPEMGPDVDLPATVIDTIDQLKSLSITLTPTEKKLTLGLSLSAKPGTEIANMLVADPDAKSGFQLSGKFRDDAAINVIARIHKPLLKKFIDTAMKMIPEEMSAAAAPEGMLDMKTFVMKHLEFLGDETAISILPGNEAIPFKFTQITKITDRNAANILYRAQFKMLTEAKGPDGKSLAEITKDRYCTYYSMNMPSPDGKTKSIDAAFYGNWMVTSVGDNAETKRIVESLRDFSIRSTNDMDKAKRIVDNWAANDFTATLNLIRIISLSGKVASTLPTPQAQMIGGMLSGMEGNSKSCMVLFGKVEGGRFDLGIVMPKDHLAEVVKAGMQLQQKMMQDMMMQPGPNGSSGSIKF